MNAAETLAFVKEHGIVLVSARGPVPRLTELIAGEPIAGSWWAHPKSHEIFRVLQKLKDSPDILQCRLVLGNVTWVHRRLWPALVQLADRFHADQLVQIQEEHTGSGKHVTHTVAFPQWVPPEVFALARQLGAEEARALLAAVIDLPYRAKRAAPTKAAAPTRAPASKKAPAAKKGKK
ncbi:MAG TPA: hypothetical protein VGD63_15650 [Steroidobacteraceae bacterium]